MKQPDPTPGPHDILVRTAITPLPQAPNWVTTRAAPAKCLTRRIIPATRVTVTSGVVESAGHFVSKFARAAGFDATPCLGLRGPLNIFSVLVSEIINSAQGLARQLMNRRQANAPASARYHDYSLFRFHCH